MVSSKSCRSHSMLLMHDLKSVVIDWSLSKSDCPSKSIFHWLYCFSAFISESLTSLIQKDRKENKDSETNLLSDGVKRVFQ